MTAVVGGTAVLGAAGWALAEGLGAPGTPAAGTTSVATAAFDPGGTGHPGDHVRGTVTAENGSTWTVTTATGKAVTVTLTPQTAFGSTKKPETAAQFPVGARVAVAGTGQDDTHVTATHVGAPHRERGVRGKVTAENGSTWTVTTAKGKAVTVTLTPRTAFGTKKAPATVAQFPVSSEVRVLGTREGDGAGGQGERSLTASRILAPRAHAAPGAPATPAPAVPGTS